MKYVVKWPGPHKVQSIFLDWKDLNPIAQVLIAPCGTKLGKSFGSAMWLAREALIYPNLYCLWVAPTYMKSRVGYRYICNFLNIPDVGIDCKDGRLEIFLPNGSYIRFLHGKDPETAVEGEAVDRFVVDEAGKQTRQLWYSLMTTISQTLGLGIITGTPRGFGWYAELFNQARAGDPMLCWAQLSTKDSPFVSAQAIANAERLLPKMLFYQYYLAQFISFSSVFGDTERMWDESLLVEPNAAVWFHPDKEERDCDACTGVDWAKVNDYTVFFTVNARGKLIGYCRFRGGSYNAQIAKLERYLGKFKGDMMLRYDRTGVGIALEDMLAQKDIDASVTGVNFTNASKQEMITRTTIAIEEGWFKAPRIERIETELVAYEVNVTRSGLHSYNAPEGEHDDVVSAMILAVSGSFESASAEATEKMIAEVSDSVLRPNKVRINEPEDPLAEYADVATSDEIDDDWDEPSDEEFDGALDD